MVIKGFLVKGIFEGKMQVTHCIMFQTIEFSSI